MDKEGTSRVRAPNYTLADQEVLLALIEEHRVVESKRTDRDSRGKKAREWEAITIAFNSCSVLHKRTTKNLQDLWKNMKARAKSDSVAEKREMRKTGGGLSNHQPHPLSSRVTGTARDNRMHYIETQFLCFSAIIPSQVQDLQAVWADDDVFRPWTASENHIGLIPTQSEADNATLPIYDKQYLHADNNATIPQHLCPATNPLIYLTNPTLGQTSPPILLPNLITNDGIVVPSRESTFINDITEIPR